MHFLDADPEGVAFPNAHCPKCDRQVMLYRDLNPQQELIERCLDCDHELKGEQTQAWSPTQAKEQGYRLEGQDAGQQKGSCGNCGH